MNEEELLLFKEELAEIKASRYSLLGFGVFMVIFGGIWARMAFTGDVSLYRLIIIFFGAIATICILVDGVNALQLFQKRYPDIAPASITALYDFIADKRRK